MRRLRILVCAALLAGGLAAQSNNFPYVLKRLAGTLSTGDGGPATSAYLLYPTAAITDAAGNLYILDGMHNSVRKVTLDGKIKTLFTVPYGSNDLRLAADGSFYVAAFGQVVRITASGTATPVAGNGTLGYSGDLGPATSAQVGAITSLAFDAAGNLYLADYTNNRVREVTLDGNIKTIAGTGANGSTGDNGAATAAQLNPFGVAIDANNNIYVSDDNNHRVRKISAAGIISTIAGTGTAGQPKDGPATSSPLENPAGLLLDSSGNLYITDNFGLYGVVLKMGTDGSLKRVAGSYTGYNLTDDTALNSTFLLPHHVSMDSNGILYITDEDTHRVRTLGPDGNIHTVAGAIHFAGNGGPATSAVLNQPRDLVLDAQGNILVSDSFNYLIRKITSDGVINAFAGDGVPGYPSDGTPINTAPIYRLRGMSIDAAGNMYMGDNLKVTKITSGTFVNVAGTGNGGNTGDGGQAALATFGLAAGVAVDTAGNVYAADSYFNRVRKISVQGGTISAYAGVTAGTVGFFGDGGPATGAQFNFPGTNSNQYVPLATDQKGNLYIGDTGNNRIRMVNPAGNISTVVGNGTFGRPVDGQSATQTPFSAAAGIAVDAAGNLYLTSLNYSDVYQVSGGIIRRVSGGGTATVADGLTATATTGLLGGGIQVDANGDLYTTNSVDQVWKLILNSPTSLTVTGGNSQTGTVGSALPTGLKVLVTGRAGVGVAGVTVNFSVTSGSATLSAPSAVTDATGTASINVTLGAAAGSITVAAAVAGTSLPTAQFALTAIAGGTSNCGVGPPSVTSVKSLTDFGGFSTFASGSYLEVKGSNLAVDTRIWTGSDFSGSNAPIGLDGSGVSINSLAGFVYYISPTQIDVQAPADSATGTVPLVVVNCGGASAPFSVQKAAIAPGLLAPASFNIGGKQYLVALFQDGVTYVGSVGLIAGVPFRPAKPGDSITTYGVGFGGVTPAVAPGVVVPQANNIPNLTIGFGQTPAAVSYAGLAVGTIGLYQFNITVPAVADGDYQINVSVGATPVQQTLYLTVGH